MPLDAIERFSGPPLAERAWISEQARACIVRPGSDDLETIVLRDLRDRGTADLTWDAWRREDGRWTVVAAVGEDSRVSTWVYDARSRAVHPDDTVAHRLASADVVVPIRPSSSTVSLPREEPAAPEGTPIEDALIEDALIDDAPIDDVPPEPAPSDVADDAPAGRAKSRKGRRASVPRWDEILFGAGQNDS